MIVTFIVLFAALTIIFTMGFHIIGSNFVAISTLLRVNLWCERPRAEASIEQRLTPELAIIRLAAAAVTSTVAVIHAN